MAVTAGKAAATATVEGAATADMEVTDTAAAETASAGATATATTEEATVEAVPDEVATEAEAEAEVTAVPAAPIYACCGSQDASGAWQCNGACRRWFHAGCEGGKKGGDKAMPLCSECLVGSTGAPRAKRQRL